ncbi:enzymatic polyprotein [Labeo rohita]|uniref:Enzymatic polyprotein n=1 Tax=Labeo rohita TaxID=84645 RepID=A0ABQ8LT30_LABRO|nr:enzymatic polyprotein [Labeo rohita]
MTGSLTVKQFQRLLGLMAAASNVIPFGLLYMRPIQWWLKTRGFSPRGNPLRMIKVTRRCLRALDMWRKPWFLSQGPVLRAPCRRVTLATDASLTGWGAVMNSHPARGLWSGHQLTWHINCLEMLAVFLALKHFLPDLRDRHVLVRTDNTAVVSYINHQGGLRSRPLVQAGAPDPCVVPGQTPLAESSLCTWASQLGSRHPVEAGAEARGMDASPRGGEADMESVWSSPSGSLCHEGEHAMSPLVLSSSSSSPGAGCYGTDMAEASSPVLAGPSMVLGPDFSPRRLSLGDSRQERSPLTGRGFHSSPPAGAVEALGVASEGAHLLASGLSTEVVETILQSRAPSTRKLYALKWKLFTSWCGRYQQDPVNCPVGSVMEFLQDRLSAGLTHSTLKVYVAAIAAYHAPLGGLSVGKNPLVTRFLRGALRPPRVGDLQALSVAPSFLEFAPGLSKAFLYPRPGYVPKVPSSTPRPAFCPSPYRDPDQQKLNCMCPVRALDTYVHRAARWRKSDQLFVCYGPPKKGLPASKQTLSHWIVDAICSAYESSDLPPPLGVKTHSTRSMAASKAFLAGVSMQDICNAHILGRDWGLVAWASRSHSVSTRLEFLKGNETPRLVAILLRPCERCFSPWKLTLVLAHVLLCFLVSDVTRL